MICNKFEMYFLILYARIIMMGGETSIFPKRQLHILHYFDYIIGIYAILSTCGNFRR